MLTDTAPSQSQVLDADADAAFELTLLNAEVQAVTAFESASALYNACRGGYTPTLKRSADDTPADWCCKRRVARWLRQCGFRAFEV
jgi:hypothetical protein